jgi:hypothetical protein
LTQRFGDLHGVQRRALAQVVGDAPEGEAVLDGGVLADARDVGRILAGGVDGRDVAAGLVLVDHHARPAPIAQDLARLVGRDRALELDVDRFAECETKTGTRTQVATSLIFGSRIFFVSTIIFHSSLVKPSSMKTSICGMRLKAMRLGNFLISAS